MQKYDFFGLYVFENMKRIVIFLFAVVLACGASAQKTKVAAFTNDDFPGQFKLYMANATKEDENLKKNEKLYQQLAGVWNATSEGMQARMLQIYNTLLKLKVRPWPDMYDFTDLLVYIASQPDQTKNFEQWVATIEFIQGRNKRVKDFTDWIEFSQQLYTHRTLYQSKSCTWQAQANVPFELRFANSEVQIVFSRPMELYYSSDRDNGTIYGTTGTLYYFDSRWQGHGGRMNWQRTGIASSVCYAILNDYEAITKFPKFIADSVQFTNTNYFSKPIYGRVEESLSAKMEPEKYTFPKFRSYQTDFVMNDLLPGVNYQGSFMMNGARFITSDDKNPATMIFMRNGSPFIEVSSTKFIITHSKLSSESAAIKIHIDGDTICNDGIMMRYIVADSKVTLLNDSKRNYYSPYSNSYHNLDMYCESITWNRNEDKLTFSMLGESGNQHFSSFESSSYYSERKMKQIQGIDEINPVMRVKKYIQYRHGLRDFYIEEFAQWMHLDLAQTKLMVHILTGSGLLSYSENDGHIFVKDKLDDYAKAFSHDKKHDYDAIILQSEAKGSNAELDLKSFDLNIHGVKKFVVSDSQQVAIYPKRGDLTVQRNRHIDFSGRIDVGRFILFVTNAAFSYENFNIDLPKVDSLRFYVKTFDNAEHERLVRTPLFDLVGSLTIDEPDNHNGLKRTKDFPIFDSRENSYVYYDSKEVQHGAYTRDKFYFTIKPFSLRNLVKAETDSIIFNGVLTSAGIFPDIEEPLKVQPDYSLGFVRQTPKGGYPTYGGKGHFTSTIDLSYHGLHGRGKLDYLTSVTQSKTMLFLPDSMIAVTDTFFVRPEGNFPDINNSRTLERWYPYRDSMQVAQLKDGKPFRMYRNETLLSGYVGLRPQGAMASGGAEIREGTLQSNHFELAPTEMDSRTSSFTLRSDIYRNTAFYATNVTSHVDYTQHRADFVANDAIGKTQLPLLQYIAEVDKFTWEMDKQQLDLKNSKSEDSQGLEGLNLRERVERGSQPGARFVSSNPKCDSLQFHSTRATYSYNDAQLSCHNVFTINIGDAVAAPSGDSLHISNGGAIDLINKAQILASRQNRYHLFYNADLLIKGARDFAAKGYIDYIDESDKHQKIYMQSIAPNAQGITVAEGSIADSANFTLNDALGFAGKVRVESDKQNYHFSGGVRLLHHCTPVEKLGLLAFADYLDPKNIQVSVPELPTDWKGNRIEAAILFDKTNLAPFSAFLTNDRAADNTIINSYGYLTYDSKSHDYIIAPRNKLEDFDNVVERYLTLNTDRCTLKGEGPLSIGLNHCVEPTIAFGSVDFDPNKQKGSTITIQSIFGISFPIDSKVIDALAQQIADDLRLSSANTDNETLRHALIYYEGEEQGESDYMTYVSSGALEKVPKEFSHTLFFSNIEWEYSAGLGYHYDGVTTLSLVGKRQLNLATRLKAQIHHKGNATFLTLYLQIAGDHWYYFNYEVNSRQLVIYSSVGEWVDMIKSIPADKRQVSDKTGSFRYRIGTSRNEVPNFLLRFGQGGSTSDEDYEEEDEQEPEEE